MLNFKTEFSRADGLYKSIVVKEHKYDLVEFTVTQKLTDPNTSKVISDTGYKTFYTNKEFKDFFEPLINELKVKFNNDNIPTNP